jgi:hypothetical protein
MKRALNTDELYRAFNAAAVRAFDDGDREARKQLRFAEELLEPFAMGYLATALLEELEVGVDA